MKLPTGKWKRYDHGVRLADSILFIGGSLKHTSTMLDDLTTACNFTPPKPQSSPIRHQCAEEATRWKFKE